MESLRENDMGKLEKTLRVLLPEAEAAGKDGNRVMSDWKSPRLGNLLHFAAAFGGKTLCQALIAGGVDVNATDAEGNTPLHKAAMV